MSPLSLPIKRPLLPLQAVQAILDCSEDGALFLLQRGRLAWAVDLKTPKAKRSLIRVSAASVQAYVDRQPDPLADFPALLSYTFGLHHGGTIPAARLARISCVSSSHIQELIRAGCLRALSKSRPGPAGSPRISFDSLARFLESRRFRQ